VRFGDALVHLRERAVLLVRGVCQVLPDFGDAVVDVPVENSRRYLAQLISRSRKQTQSACSSTGKDR
jgi:hypothetical protein